MKTLLATTILVTAATGALAGDAFDVSGTSLGKSSSTYVPMGDSHIFVDLASALTLPDNGTPTAGMSGNCFGYVEIALGQGASGSGVCSWSDADGDTWYGPWQVNAATPEGAMVGVWSAAGGTGKFIGASGGGSFTSLTNPATGEVKLDVAGSMTMN